MSSILVIAVIAVLVAGGYWAWSRQRPVQARTRKSEPRLQPFASVRIRVGIGACDAAQALVDEHFLVKQAPMLPLRECKAPRCQCSFEKSSDRRAETRRWADEGIGAQLFGANERRAVPDRREDD